MKYRRKSSSYRRDGVTER